MFGLDTSVESDMEDSASSNLYEVVADWDDKERLTGEKETLGFYLKGHPINRYEKELEGFVTSRLNNFKIGSVLIAGYIMSIRTRTGSRGRMAELRLDDRTGRALVNVYSDEYQKYRNLLLKDQLIIVKGKAIEDDYVESGVSIRASNIYSLDEIRKMNASLILMMESSVLKNGGVEHLKQTLSPFKNGTSDVYIRYNNGQAVVNMCLGEDWRLSINDELLDKLSESIGKDNVKIDYNTRRF